ncbi:MAG: hypothetical protein IPM69_18995 [Ignavibacteria bacterium]|nr:hypothetical protein [Ignavibacteria bacterium]
MKKQFLLITIAVLTSAFQLPIDTPTVESINARYFHILPSDKNILTVDVRLDEFKTSIAQISAKLLSNGEKLAAKQFANLYAKVTYNKSADSIRVDLSPFTLNEKSPLYKSTEQFTSGYKKTVKGSFQTIKSTIMNAIINGYVSKPKIEIQQDKVIVHVDKNGSKELYTFSNNFRDIKLLASSKAAAINATMTTTKMQDKILISTFDFVSKQANATLKFTYATNTKTIVLKQLHTDSEVASKKHKFTFQFSNWVFK